ncbi:molybdopterin cofactor-binding domain-containing protein [Escherichia coli]
MLDCGTPVDPELALGQIYGATLRAIGHSMSEEIIYNAEGHPLTRDLRSYGAPKIGDIPRDLQALCSCDDKVGPIQGEIDLGNWCKWRSSGDCYRNSRCLRHLVTRMAFHTRNAHRAGKNISNKWPLRRPVSLFER